MNTLKDYWNNKWATRFEDRGDVPSDFVKEVAEHIKDKNIKTVLDLGCGAGRDSFYLYKLGYKITAQDISKEALKFLQNKTGDIEFICNDIKDFNFEKEKYDLILANLALHFFDEETTKRIFNNIKRSITPNGYFCFRSKSTKDPLFGQGEKIDEYTYKNEEHSRRFFDEKYVRELLIDFEIITIKETQDFYYKPSSFIETIATKKDRTRVKL